MSNVQVRTARPLLWFSELPESCSHGEQHVLSTDGQTRLSYSNQVNKEKTYYCYLHFSTKKMEAQPVANCWQTVGQGLYMEAA